MDFRLRLLVAFVWLSADVPALSQIRGVILNAETGQRLPKVDILLSASEPFEADYSATTDETGQFEFCGVSPGVYQLMVSAVGFGLIKRDLEVLAEELQELEIYRLAICGRTEIRQASVERRRTSEPFNRLTLIEDFPIMSALKDLTAS
jgi:hypothetical protein